MHRGIYLNLAHIALIRWAFKPGQVEPEHYLSAAVRWGERAGRTWQRSGHSERAQMLWKRVTTHDALLARRRAEAAYRQAQTSEHEGHLESALAAYRHAFAEDERQIEVGYKVYRLAMQVGRSRLAQRQVQALYALVPEYPVTLTLDDGITLLGYDLDETSLERDVDPIPVILYWELPAPLEDVSQWQAGGWMYVGVQDRLYQIGVVDNLLPNGGFERDLSTMAIIPHGYKNNKSEARYQAYRYDFLRMHHRVMVDRRDGNITQVAALVNPVEELNGMMPVHGVTMVPGALYVLGGWMRVMEGGSGYLGGVWRTAAGEVVRYWYATKERHAQPWQQVVATVAAPEDETLAFSLLALNRGEGEVYFDDLILFPIVPPQLSGGQ